MSAENTPSKELITEPAGEKAGNTLTAETSGQSSPIISSDPSTQNETIAPAEEPTGELGEEQAKDTENSAEHSSTHDNDSDDEAQYFRERFLPLGLRDPFALEWNEKNTDFLFEILNKHNIVGNTINLVRCGRFVKQSKNPYLLSIGTENPPKDTSKVVAEIRDAVFDLFASFFDTPERKASLLVEVKRCQFRVRIL